MADKFTSYSINLTGSDFQKLTSDVTFRFYATSGGTNKTVQFDDFVINGEVVPEPSAPGLTRQTAAKRPFEGRSCSGETALFVRPNSPPERRIPIPRRLVAQHRNAG